MSLYVQPIKYVKNLTGGDLEHTNTGTTFSAGEYQEVDELILYRLNDSQFQTWWDAGSLMYAEANDSSADFTNKYEGWHRLFNYSMNTPFISSTNRSNNFDAESMQEAAEEIDFRQIIKEPTGFLNNTDSEISFNDGTLTFSIEPVGDSFSFWNRGKRFDRDSADTVAITDTEGTWFIYYNSSGVLTASQTIWDFETDVFVSVLYWDATNNKAIWMLDERHGVAMDWSTHQYLHRTRFTQIDDPYEDFPLGDYISQGDGSLDTHAQFSLGNGTIHDEDLAHAITNSATPTNPFEQKLSTVAYIPLYYVSGASDVRKISATAFPVSYDGVNPIDYNYFNTSTELFSLENAADGEYLNMFYFATNNIDEPIVGILGRVASTNVASVLNEQATDVLEQFPFQEYTLLYRIIYKTDSNYTNTPKAALYLFNDLRYLSETQDRYLWECGYNANAGVRRYMERLGLGMDEAPFPMPEDGYVRTITLQTTAINTGTIGVFLDTDLVTPVFSITMTAKSYERFDVTRFFNQDDKLVFKVTSGTFSKPQLTVINQTNIDTD